MYNTTLSCQRFRKRELENFQNWRPELFSHFEERSSAYYRMGMQYFQEIIGTGELSQDLVYAALDWRKKDARFNFLYDVPVAAFYAAAKANKLEQAFFGKQTAEVAQLGMLVSIFTNLLDGIVDEVPEIISKADLKFVGKQLVGQSWIEKRSLSELRESIDRHPVVSLLLESLDAIIRRVLKAEAWQKQEDIREEYRLAVTASFTSELNSMEYIIGQYWPEDFEQTAKGLEHKSVAPAWVGLLSPVCFHGWPSGINKTHFKTLANHFGEFGGWLDDIADLNQDLEGLVWSNVLLEIYRITRHQSQSASEVINLMLWGIDDPGIAAHLSRIGIQKLKGLEAEVDQLPVLEKEVLRQAIADVILVFLRTEEDTLSFYKESYATA